MADYKVSGTNLTSIANAIRAKGGIGASLEFPDGFVTAIANIPTGQQPVLVTKTITENGTYSASSDNADGYSSVTVSLQDVSYESGTFTCPDTGTIYTLNFSKTYSKYFILIEATESSIETIIASGATSVKTFALHGFYPKLNVNNTEVTHQTILNRIKPSDLTTNADVPTSNFTYSSTSFSASMGAITTGANYLYRGLTYNYYIVEIK